MLPGNTRLIPWHTESIYFLSVQFTVHIEQFFWSPCVESVEKGPPDILEVNDDCVESDIYIAVL